MKNEPILFKPLSEAPQSIWRKPGGFAFAKDISQIPVSDTELLLTSYYLPIAIDCLSERPRVVAIIDPRFQRTPAIGPQGQWQKGYLPLALRCLPFRLGASVQGKQGLEIAVNLPHGDEPGQPLFAKEQALSQEVRQISGLLQRLEEGKQHLQQAAEQLLIAGLLTPIQLHRSTKMASGARSFTVNRDTFSALSGARIALIAKDSFLPIDLAMACIFSQRLMPTLVSVTERSDALASPSSSALGSVDELINPIHLNVQVDDSELFSFETFQNAERA